MLADGAPSRGRLAGVVLAKLDEVVDEFRRAHPGVTVNLKGGVGSEDLKTELDRGRGPDLDANYDVELLAQRCSDGDYRDLGPLLADSGIKPELFHPIAWRALAVGRRHCAIPYLADTFGL